MRVHVWDESDPVAYLKSRGVELDVLMKGECAGRGAAGARHPGSGRHRRRRILHRARTTGTARDDELRKVIADALSKSK